MSNDYPLKYSRRKEERHSVFDIANIGIEQKRTANILNISNSGICLETDLYLENGESNYIYSTPATSTLDKPRLYGEVRWRQKINDSFSGMYRYGIFFSKMHNNVTANSNNQRHMDILEPYHFE